MRDEKIRNQLPIADRTFFIVILHSSLVKALVNAPCLRKLCKDCLIGFGAMVLTKRLHFFIFQLPQAEHVPLRTCQLRRS
jgi:hypothetical protein